VDAVEHRENARAKAHGARVALDAVDDGRQPRRGVLLAAIARLLGVAARHEAIAEELEP